MCTFRSSYWRVAFLKWKAHTTEKNESELKNSYSFLLPSGLLIAKAGEFRQGLFVCIYLFLKIYKINFDCFSLWTYLFYSKNDFRKYGPLGNTCIIILFLHDTFFTVSVYLLWNAASVACPLCLVAVTFAYKLW